MAATIKTKGGTAYASQYGDAINKLTDAVVNRQQFTYDPNTDASYQAYAKQYGRLGDRARINTLGDYAANTGGYASTAAVSAAQQAQNDYNQQLSNMIPSLMQAAYDRYQGEFNMNLGAMNALASRDDAMYGRWNDQRNYDRDVYESDRSYNYTSARDKVLDSQWAQEFGLDKDKFAWTKQQGNSGSGGGSGRSGGGRSSSGGSGGNNNDNGDQEYVTITDPATGRKKTITLEEYQALYGNKQQGAQDTTENGLLTTGASELYNRLKKAGLVK